jgi:hypothetical protein
MTSKRATSARFRRKRRSGQKHHQHGSRRYRQTRSCSNRVVRALRRGAKVRCRHGQRRKDSREGRFVNDDVRAHGERHELVDASQLDATVVGVNGGLATLRGVGRRARTCRRLVHHFAHGAAEVITMPTEGGGHRHHHEHQCAEKSHCPIFYARLCDRSRRETLPVTTQESPFFGPTPSNVPEGRPGE